MTKLKTEVIPGFDVLEWKRKIQTEIYDEIKDMTTTEVVDYFRQAGERFDEARKRYQNDNEQPVLK